MKTIHYTSGLPRACSTLLQNLLAQNPRVHATGTSGVHEIMYLSKAFFKTEEFRKLLCGEGGGSKGLHGLIRPALPFFETEEFRSSKDKGATERVFWDYVSAGSEAFLAVDFDPAFPNTGFARFHQSGISHAFDNFTTRPVVVDKCRSWIGSANLLFQLFPDAKLLVPVRDIRGVLSSMEKKYQQHPSFQLEGSQVDTARVQTIEGRCQFWLDHPPVGIAVQRLHELAKNHKDKVMFVHAEALTNDTQNTMNKVWEYLGEEPFIHNTQNVEQYTQEHELGWPFGDHTIRQEVKPLKPDWHETLGRQLSEALNQKFQWINEL